MADDQYTELRDLIYRLAEAIAGSAIAKNDTHLASAVIAAVRKKPVLAPDTEMLNAGGAPVAGPIAPGTPATPARRLTQE